MNPSQQTTDIPLPHHCGVSSTHLRAATPLAATVSNHSLMALRNRALIRSLGCSAFQPNKLTCFSAMFTCIGGIWSRRTVARVLMAAR